MSLIDVEVTGKDAEITPIGYNELRVEVKNVDVDYFLDNVTEEQCIEHFSDAKILDTIGEERVREYFGIE